MTGTVRTFDKIGLAFIKIGLGPVLLAQGFWVRKRKLLLPEPAGVRSGISGSGPVLRLMIVGDSAAAGVGVETQDEALLGQLVNQLARKHTMHWRLEARTGATSASTLKYLEKCAPDIFDVVVLSLGVNDVTSGATKEAFLAQQAMIYSLLNQKFGAKRIVVCGLPPMGRFPALPQPLRWYLGFCSQDFDRALERLAATVPHCLYYRQPTEGSVSMMATDGFHPGAPIYALWARNISCLLEIGR
jgi:lysophospholipase L1-like esterase